MKGHKMHLGMMQVGSAFLCGLLFLQPTVSLAETALETVKMHTDEVMTVLQEPAVGSKSAKSAKFAKIRAISEKMFDYHELSRRTLAGNWDRFSPEQQKEFLQLYRSLLEDVYAEKILGYTDEKIVFVKEVPIKEKTSEVRTAIIRKNEEIPVHYRVILKGGEWKVYDVIIEGVSLTNNYRSQFREMLAAKTPESLLESMRDKTKKK